MTMYEAFLLGCRQAADLSVMKLMILHPDRLFFCVNTLMQEEFRERKQELDRKLERVGGLKKC